MVANGTPSRLYHDGQKPSPISDDRGENDMIRKVFVMLAMAGILGGCENMSPGQKGAVAGGALGTGIGMVAGGSFGQVVGAGLIGGAVGYVGGSALGK
jgi:hypothetical protein